MSTSIAEQQAQRFGRFGEQRQVGNDFDSYDDSDAPAPSVTLDTHLSTDNVGYQMLQKMGWKKGRGLGRALQGRTDPVPIVMKEDIMGLGRMTVEMSKVEGVTEKRRQLEIEKEDTPELIQRYMNNIEKEQHIAESTADLRQTYYCEECDKQYKTYSEYDNHVNSYDHAHRVRLKELHERDFNRKMSAHRKKKKGDKEKDREELSNQRLIALERARMTESRLAGKSSGGFTAAIPVGAPRDDESHSPATAPAATSFRTSFSSSEFQPTGGALSSSVSLAASSSSSRLPSSTGSAAAEASIPPAIMSKLSFTPVSFSKNSPASNPLPPLPGRGGTPPPLPSGLPPDLPPLPPNTVKAPPLPPTPQPPLPPQPLASSRNSRVPPLPTDPQPPLPPAAGPSLSFGFKKQAVSASATVAKAKLGFSKPIGRGKLVTNTAFGGDDDDDDEEEVAPTLRGKFISGSSSRW